MMDSFLFRSSQSLEDDSGATQEKGGGQTSAH